MYTKKTMFSNKFSSCGIDLGGDDSEPDTLQCTILPNAVPRLRPEQQLINFMGIRDYCMGDWHICVLWEDDLSRVDCVGFEFRQNGAHKRPLTALSRNKMPMGIHAPYTEKPFNTLRMYDGYNLVFDGFRFPIASRFPGENITRIACSDPPSTYLWFNNSNTPGAHFGTTMDSFFTAPSSFFIGLALAFLYSFMLVKSIYNFRLCENSSFYKFRHLCCCCCLSERSKCGWYVTSGFFGVIGSLLTVFSIPNIYFKILWFVAGAVVGSVGGFYFGTYSRSASTSFVTTDDDDDEDEDEDDVKSVISNSTPGHVIYDSEDDDEDDDNPEKVYMMDTSQEHENLV